MPAPMIKTLIEKSGKSEKEVEKAWKEAKKAAGETYSIETESDKFWGTVVTIIKKKLGIKDAIKTVIYQCKGCSSEIDINDGFCPECGVVFRK